MSTGAYDSACLFCKIAVGQIPCHKVYEDEAVLAFLDIGPIVRGHTLVIPRAHYRTVMEIPEELLAQVNRPIPKLARVLLAATGARACHVLVNSGPEASQSVQHLHYHILPRFTGDGYHLSWPAGKLDAAQAQQLQGAIAAALSPRG